MKNIKIYFALCFISIFICCDKEETNSCFNASGTIVKKEFFIDAFSEVIVNDNIELFVIDSDENKIIIETDENYLNNIDINIASNILEITNNNTCFYTKDFSNTKAYVYSSNINKIRNSSTLTISSIGVLNYPSLELLSENYLSDYLVSGDFNLNINTSTLKIVANGYSNFKLKGNCNSLNINFAANSPRFEGEELITQKAFLFARSTNDILINITDEVSGNLYSTGNVILVSEPLTNTLKTYYTGEIIEDF